MQTMVNPNQLLTVQEVARLLRVDQSTVRRWIREGSLLAVELPHRGKRLGFRIKEATITAMMEPAFKP